jgi:hypothetical protein
VAPYRNFYRDNRDFTEWNLAREPVKDWRDRKADDENERGPDIEGLFDAAIRHRFGLLISRAAKS